MSRLHRIGRGMAQLAVATLLVGTLVPRPVAAQGSFYREERRDGRIFVFNLMTEYQSWQKTGEMGKAITRIGAGPDGETMVFDSEPAIHLYNFKHDRPGEVIESPKEKVPLQKFSWKDGKTSFESDNAKLTISNRVQIRYTVEDLEGKDAKGSFRIRRAKTKFEGFFFNPKWTYELQLNWPDTANPLEDAQVNYDFYGNKTLMVKAGQFKVPFGRQELTSSGSQQFVDRSIVSGEFEKGRDAGVQVWGETAGTKIEYRFGVFNGNGRTRSANDNSEYQYNGRIMFQPWGDVKYSESDFESKDKPLFAVAANFEVNDGRPLADAEGKPIGTKRTVFGADGAFKYRGFSAMAEYFLRNTEPEAADAADFDSDGFHFQAGYFFVPARFEVAGRYATFDPTDAKGGNDRNEWGVAFNYFWNKHPLKLQGDYRRLEDEAKGTDDNEIRVQIQVIF